MKKLIGTLAVAAIALQSSAASAGIDFGKIRAAQLSQFSLEAAALNLIDWKVGDQLNHDIKLGGFALGKSVKEVYEDLGDALWFRQSMDLMGQKDVTEILIGKADGQIRKIIRNGKEEQLPETDIEIIKQEYTEVTVPAGTFKVIYILARSKDSDKIQVWMNPRDIPMDGTAKQSVAMQLGELTLELTEMKRGQ